MAFIRGRTDHKNDIKVMEVCHYWRQELNDITRGYIVTVKDYQHNLAAYGLTDKEYKEYFN